MWRREVRAHEFVSRFRDKKKFTDVTLDELAPLQDSDALDNEVWCLESMNDEEIERSRRGGDGCYGCARDGVFCVQA